MSAAGPASVRRGVLLAVASGTTYAVTTMLAERIAATTTPLALTSVATGAGAVALLPLGLLGARGDAPLVTSDPVVVVTLLYLGVFTMALAYGLLYAGLQTTTGSAAVVASLLSSRMRLLCVASESWLIRSRSQPPRWATAS